MYFKGKPILQRYYPKPPRVKVIRERVRMRYKGKMIELKENPRTGYCSICNWEGLTHIHHFAEYHDDDPLKDTIELCPSCHAKQHKVKP